MHGQSHFRLPGSPRWVIPLMVLAGILALSIDLPVARFCHIDHGGRFAHDFLDQIEPFGQPVAVLIVCLSLYLTRGVTGREARLIALGAVMPGIIVNIIKGCVGRMRPNYVLTLPDFSGEILDTFQGWFLLWFGGSKLQSFPSGHTAFVAGFCLSLWARFPRAGWLFCTVAVLVALQRIEGAAHFVSDTIWGAAVAYAYCAWQYGHPNLNPTMESRVNATSDR